MENYIIGYNQIVSRQSIRGPFFVVPNPYGSKVINEYNRCLYGAWLLIIMI